MAKKWLTFISVLGSETLSFLSKNIDTNLVLLLKYKAKNRRNYLNKTYHSRNLYFSKKLAKFFLMLKD